MSPGVRQSVSGSFPPIKADLIHDDETEAREQDHR